MGAAVGGELNTVLLILNTKEALDVFANSTQVTLGGNLGKFLTPRGLTIASKAWYASHELVRPSSPTTGADGISTATAGAFFDAVDQVGLGTVSTAALREGVAHATKRKRGRVPAGTRFWRGRAWRRCRTPNR